MPIFTRALLVASLVLATGSALAQNYPSQTVKMIVPFVAGGGVDVVARMVAPRLGEELGQSVIIENRGGAGGMLGAAAVAQSPPDGYTLLFGTGSTHGTNSSVYSRLPYDPVRDFVPVVLVSSSPLLLVVPPSLPANSVKNLIELARSRPGELSFASYGTGSINHLGAELFNSMAGIQANHVPYRGSAPALTDLIAGRVHYTFDGVSTSLGYIQAGTIRVLGVAGPRRTPALPDQPTISETALPGFDTTVWFGLFAPAGTPKTAVDLVNSKMNAVLASSRVKENFHKLGIEAVGGSPDVLTERVKSEMQKWAGLVREKNIRLDQGSRGRWVAGSSPAMTEESDAMSAAKRQMHLGVFVLGTGNHSAGWRYDRAATSNCSWPVMQSIARIAERGKFDLFFISDGLAMDPGDHPSFVSRFEPTTLIGALSAVTRHIGLGATVSTSFDEPFHVARAFASLDHLSGGRAAWNVVTSTHNAAALNFSKERLHEHDLRYEIATEFVDVVRGLWDTWEDRAVIADKTTGTFLDKSKVRALNHKGRFFSVKGPLNIERCPQGHPVIIQAGGSPPGQELSARSADLVFSVVNGDPASAKAAYAGLKQRVVKHGRAPEALPILPGVMPIIGETDEQAKEQLGRLQSWLTSTNALALVSQRLGHDISGCPLDGPVPEFPQTDRGQAFSKALFDMARREKMTLRDLYNVTAAARGHWVIYGTPQRIADIFEEWFTGGMADGFVVMPAYFPGAFDDFVDRVVPQLQRRGLFRREYCGSTLRDHLGLARPPRSSDLKTA